MMYVIKRDGSISPVLFDEITKRLKECCEIPKKLTIDPVIVTQKVVSGIYNGIKTVEIDVLAAETSAYMSTINPQYAELAARIAITSLHKETSPSFSETIKKLFFHVNPLVSRETYEVVMKNRLLLDSAIDYSRDFDFDYFGYKTLEKSYLLRINGKVVERPQHMFMRVSIGIHGEDIESALKTYKYLSEKWFIHATPTMFNSGTPFPQMSSCFLLPIKDDSIEGIYETLKECALISKYAGGIGISIHHVRATNSYVRGTNGTSNGIVPMLKVFNDTARYVDQGGGKRKGAFAIYLEPWHADIFEFLELRKNHGKEELRARDLFYGLWIPDLFMKRVEKDLNWSLFCPNEAPGLHEVYGEDFEKLYEQYESEGRARKIVKARELWNEILKSQIETGTPYMLYKDTCNRRSNQKNLGTIKSSNLCAEIIEYSSSDETAVCNLASISLPRFIKGNEFDHEKLFEVTYHITENLNKIIDKNFYPVPSASKSNLRHRPIGIGVQGLADLFCLLRLPFTSVEAKKLNQEIFETIYYAALSASKDLSKKFGPYETFKGSPASQGILHFDLCGVQIDSKRWDWKKLKDEIVTYGLRNSLLIALMPTASTSQILGNNECFEPYTSNIYTRRVLAGEFIVINKHLVNDLIKLGIWNEKIKDKIIFHEGSIQEIDEIPKEIKEIYKTVWEIKQKDLIDMAVDRGIFIDQSQSLNVFMKDPTIPKLSSLHFYAWRKGLKTGMYYLRTLPVANPIKFTVQLDACSRRSDCISCGS